MMRLRARATVEIVVEIPGDDVDDVSLRDVAQAVQDEIGHTGAIVEDVDGFELEAD